MARRGAKLASENSIEPDAIRKLVSRVGAARVSEMIGCSKGHLSDVAGGHVPCRKAYELAARYELSKLDKLAVGTHTIVILAPAEKVDLLSTFLKGMEVEFVDVSTMKSNRSK